MFLCRDVPLCCHDLETKMKKIGNYMYRYDNTIGNGKFSKVYAGINTIKDQAVAIKVINVSAIKEKALLNLTNT